MPLSFLFSFVKKLKITDLHQKDALFQKTKERLQLALAYSNQGLWEWDMLNDLVYFDENAAKIHFLPKEGVYPREETLQFWHPSDKAKASEFLQEAFKSNKTTFDFHYRILAKEGQIYWIRSRGKFVHQNSSGKYTLMIGVLEDRTEAQRKEIELLDSKFLAEQANASKTRFLTNISHEIRTPITAILGFTEIMLKNPDQQILTEDLTQNLKYIQTAAQTLQFLLNDVLDLHKVESGKILIEEVVTDLPELVQNCLGPYRYLAQEKGVNFTLKIDPNIPTKIWSDPYRLRQIIINLISNAIKFTFEGQILIFIDLQSMESAETVIIRFTISDSGLGITKSQQEYIFDRFTQADTSTTRKFGGSGLGLSICKQLVQLMGGHITVVSPGTLQSESYVGSDFSFTIYAKPFFGAQVNGTLEKTISWTLTKPARVLLVEDNIINQVLLKKILENHKLEVCLADNGLQALERMQEYSFDLIFMDVQMPFMDGYETTKMLRMRGVQIPIVAISANVFREDIERCLSCGMNSHLAKPFHEQDLMAVLQKYLG